MSSLVSFPEATKPSLGNSQWLLRLRWCAVIGQLLTIAISYWGLNIELSVSTLVTLVAITAGTNILFWLYLRQFSQIDRKGKLANIEKYLLPGILLLDMNVLTAMLYFSGGPTNPFLFFYFVNVAIGGMILPTASAWLLVTNAIAGVLLLLNSHKTIPMLSHSMDSEQSSPLHKFSFFIAFVTSCLVVTYFMRLLYQQLAQREQQMRLAEQQQAKVHRLEALATLAAGAAHELATPLSTIAVVAKEMSRNVNRWNAPDSLRQDLTLIQEELKYCRSVLDRMRAGAGEAAAERIADITAEQVIAEVLVGLRDAQRVVVQRDALPTTSLRLPLQAVAQALRNLVQNALDATPTEQSVVLSIQQVNQGDWDIRVEDSGAGMPDSILKRIGEPFFTTKEPGKGMGLGVYLSHNVLSGLGGNLEFESRPGQGTVASIRLPKSVSNVPVG